MLAEAQGSLLSCFSFAQNTKKQDTIFNDSHFPSLLKQCEYLAMSIPELHCHRETICLTWLILTSP